MTNFTTSPTPLFAKTSHFLPAPGAAPWGPARLSPSPSPQHPRRGPRGPGPQTRRGRGGSRGLGARHGPALGAAARGEAAERRHRSGPDVAVPGAPGRGGPGAPANDEGRIPRGWGGSGARRPGAADGAGKGLPAPASSGRRRERRTRTRSLGQGRSATPSRLPEDTVVAGVPGRGDQAVLLVEELLEEGGRHFGALSLPPPPRRWAPRSAVPSPRLVPPAPLHSVSQSYDRN